MKRFIILSLVLLLIQVVNASEIISCTINPQEVNVSASIQVTVQLNNTQNVTANDTVEISFPSAYLSCVDCIKQVTTEPYSTKSVSFTLQALSATEGQSITITKPTSYTCPVLKINAAKDTTPPTVGSVSPTSVVLGQTTFTAPVSDDVGVIGCNFSANNTQYTATVSNNIASVTITLAEGTYSAYFKCWDAAGNSGTGTVVVVTATKPKLSASITLPKTTYYPAESFEPRVTVRDGEKIVIDATVSGNLTYGDKSTFLSFFYSTLCDCYKAWHWFSESTLPNDYTLTVIATRSGYQPATATATFSLIKPTLKMTMSTDKTEYNPGDSIKATSEIKDSLGNTIINAYVTGEIRDADTGGLVTVIYPRLKENIYYYEYYVGSESVGKSYTISMNVSWKEQSASASKAVSITKRGLNADIVLEKDVLVPGDILQGKIKVFDKVGSIVTDANVNMELKDSSGFSQKWLSAEYKDGFYEIERWKIGDWFQTGTYTLNVKVEKKGESITLTKSVEITKEKLNVQVFFDQTSYAPGERIYIKILVTYPNNSIVSNAYVGGEIFPLTQEVITTGKVTLISALAVGIGEPTKYCRIYISPEGPLYYKGEYIQKYYIDDAYIPDGCPTGKYAMRLKIGAPGYAETEFTKEFDVVLYKLLLETGFKMDSRPNAVDMSIYAEVKDEKGKVIPYVKIQGYLHPFGEGFEGCVQRVYLGYDELIKRYTSKVFLNKNECPTGKYLLEITASQPSYETATVEQAVEVNYSEGFEYNVVVPPSVGVPVCKEVSCGPNCVNKICMPVEECYEEVSDKDCVKDCTDKAAGIEQAVSKGEAAEFDVKNCIKNCVKKVPCKGSAVTPTQSQEMLDKLEEIRREVVETHGQVNIVEQLIRSIINFINSIVAVFGGGQVGQMNVTGITE